MLLLEEVLISLATTSCSVPDTRAAPGDTKEMLVSGKRKCKVTHVIDAALPTEATSAGRMVAGSALPGREGAS